MLIMKIQGCTFAPAHKFNNSYRTLYQNRTGTKVKANYRALQDQDQCMGIWFSRHCYVAVNLIVVSLNTLKAARKNPVTSLRNE